MNMGKKNTTSGAPLRQSLATLFAVMRMFKDSPSVSLVKSSSPRSTYALGDGRQRSSGTNHMITSATTSDGTHKACTCGWKHTFPREDNWGDIRRANTVASRHLEEHSKRGDMRKKETA
jgi:hypothetical protein